MQYTRQQYLNNECTHRQYYAQYVNEEVKNNLAKNISIDRLLASTDEHLNDISLKEWDNLSGFDFDFNRQLISRYNTIPHSIFELGKELNEGGISPATMVCIYKEAARQSIEQANQSQRNKKCFHCSSITKTTLDNWHCANCSKDN